MFLIGISHLLPFFAPEGTLESIPGGIPGGKGRERQTIEYPFFSEMAIFTVL